MAIAKKLLDAIRTNKIKELDLRGGTTFYAYGEGGKHIGDFSIKIGRKEAFELADAIRESDGIKELTVCDNDIDDEGMRAILDSVRGMKSLYKLEINNTSITTALVPEIERTIREMPQLVCFEAVQFDPNVTANETIDQVMEGVFLDVDHKNLMSISDHGPLWDLCERNTKACEHLIDVLLQGDFESMTLADMLTIEERRTGIREISNFGLNSICTLTEDEKTTLCGFDPFLDTLPIVDLSAPVTPELLTQADEQGKTPLDNLRTWQAMPELIRAAARNGTPITPEFLLEQKDKDGEPVFAIGFQFEPHGIVQAFNEQGNSMDAKVLLDPNTKRANALLTACIEHKNMAALFTMENWSLPSSAGFGAVLRQAPAEAKAKIPNLHGLTAKHAKNDRIAQQR